MIEIRSCGGFDELQACVQLEIETWGYDQTDIIPRKVFLVAQEIGGQVIGAFDSEISELPQRLVGFAMSFPGVKPGPGAAPEPYLHSHMLAVRAAYRNRGLGARLKREQRLDALSRGIRRMEWTFDPLEIKNAFLNIHKLGAVSRQYRENFYGASSSRLQGGLPTDRLVAEWELDSPRVKAALDGAADPNPDVEERILVPAPISEWKSSDQSRDRARAVQLENRGRFQDAFARGLAATGFLRDAHGNGIFELGRFGEPASEPGGRLNSA